MDGSKSTHISIVKKTYISLNLVINIIAEKRSRGVPIICILDCCRINIGDKRWPRGDHAENDGAISNVCIMYATANGRVAKDGHVTRDGKKSTNGVFTERLLRYMDSPMTLNE